MLFPDENKKIPLFSTADLYHSPPPGDPKELYSITTIIF